MLLGLSIVTSYIMSNGVAMGTYHDVAMHTDVARTLIYYVLLWPSIIFLFS